MVPGNIYTLHKEGHWKFGGCRKVCQREHLKLNWNFQRGERGTHMCIDLSCTSGRARGGVRGAVPQLQKLCIPISTLAFRQSINKKVTAPPPLNTSLKVPKWLSFHERIKDIFCKNKALLLAMALFLQSVLLFIYL